MKFLHSLIFSLLFLSSSCRGPNVPNSIAVAPNNETSSAAEPVTYTYEIVNTYAHDPESFTQGLVFDNGIFYESAGLNAQHG